jgi:integrase
MNTLDRMTAEVGRRSAEATRVWERFPPRMVPDRWDGACQDREMLLGRLLAPPFAPDNVSVREKRRLSLVRLLGWLGAQPGQTWQQRWISSGAGAEGTADWRQLPLRWLRDTGQVPRGNTNAVNGLGGSLAQLICADVIRPGIAWLLATATPQNLAVEMARSRDVNGFAAVTGIAQASPVGPITTRNALTRIAVIMAAKGGVIGDITAGDCLEIMEISRGVRDPEGKEGAGPYFYQLLHAIGVFPPDAPSTVRMFHRNFQGQLTVEQLIDRYDLACRPVRDVLVDYLHERQPSLDYATLRSLSYMLGLRFWKDLENHHPDIDSLRLAPDIAVAWKQRLQTKTITSTNASGETIETVSPRVKTADCLMAVRAFYLDITQWALEDPARWGPWAVPCPIRTTEIQAGKAIARRKSRMDQRTRERLPILPALIATADQARKDTAARLDAAKEASPGQEFTAGSQTLRRSALKSFSARVWAEDPATGKRRDLLREEERAFWAWAAVEVLRENGIRIEELTELSHHSLVQYRLPTTGETIPLLQIAPSKTDAERLLVVGPELADVLAMILLRVRDQDGSVPLVVAYDSGEKVWNPPMPLLFQRRVGMENRPISDDTIRDLINETMARANITDANRTPLTLSPHDLRRIFVTDAVMNGMPPHIAQLICGHRDINTTMGYKAVYPEEAINGHRAFIARRRELRPSEEYRTPTDQEWEEFLGHFERRRVALGDCGRAYGTNCIHEHSCVRCSLLRPDPTQRPRLREIHDNLTDRINEAQQQRWLGEVEGLKVNLAAVNAKLAQLDGLAARHATAVQLGMPSFAEASGRTVTAPTTLPTSDDDQ